MVANKENVNVGQCRVKFGESGSEADLGYTQGGVKVSVATETKDIEVDQELDPIDSIITKRTVSVEVPLAEYTIENMLLAIPDAEEVVDGTDPNKKKLLIKSKGGSMLSYAKSLILHPKDLEDSDKSEDFTFPNAAANGSIDITYDKENAKIVAATFRCFPDADGVTAIFGDISAAAGA